jgi:hypothetical protein
MNKDSQVLRKCKFGDTLDLTATTGLAGRRKATNEVVIKTVMKAVLVGFCERCAQTWLAILGTSGRRAVAVPTRV